MCCDCGDDDCKGDKCGFSWPEWNRECAIDDYISEYGHHPYDFEYTYDAPTGKLYATNIRTKAQLEEVLKATEEADAKEAAKSPEQREQEKTARRLAQEHGELVRELRECKDYIDDEGLLLLDAMSQEKIDNLGRGMLHEEQCMKMLVEKARQKEWDDIVEEWEKRCSGAQAAIDERRIWVEKHTCGHWWKGCLFWAAVLAGIIILLG